MEHPVAMALKHLGMDVEAGVAQLCDLLGKQLHAIDRVAENDGLVDTQLRVRRHTHDGIGVYPTSLKNL